MDTLPYELRMMIFTIARKNAFRKRIIRFNSKMKRILKRVNINRTGRKITMNLPKNIWIRIRINDNECVSVMKTKNIKYEFLTRITRNDETFITVSIRNTTEAINVVDRHELCKYFSFVYFRGIGVSPCETLCAQKYGIMTQCCCTLIQCNSYWDYDSW